MRLAKDVHMEELYTNQETIRAVFSEKLSAHDFVVDKTGVKMIEILGVSFIASSSTIFDEVNEDYVRREIAWYESQSRYVQDIPGGTPAIWSKVSTPEGKINSNYGWAIYSEENGSQYENALAELIRNPFSRRAEMIYTRPSMWTDYCTDGMSDFMCTDSHQYFIREGALHVCVRMRSNDVRFGFRNDRAWALHVLNKLRDDVCLKTGSNDLAVGKIFWNAGSLHVYERDFFLVDHWGKTGERSITKSRYTELYPNSEWSK